MDLNTVMKKAADEMDGQFTRYDVDHSVIIIPLSGGRFQTVLGEMRQNELYNRPLLYFSSKVCPAKPEIDYKNLMEQVPLFNYCRFIIKEDYLQVEAVAHSDHMPSETMLRETLMEVANLADQYEMKLTGADIQ